MSNKRILILSRPLSNILDEGSKNLVYYICKKLNLNLNIIVENNFSYYLPDNININRINFEINKNYVENSRNISTKYKLVKVILDFKKYDIIHSFFTLTSLNVILLIFAKIILGKKIVLNLPSFNHKSEKSILVRLIIKIADQIIVLSKFTKDKIIKNNKETHIIRPTIDSEKYRYISDNKKRNIRKKLNLDDIFTIIIPGEYNRMNMLDNVIKIIKNTYRKNNILYILSFRLKTFRDAKTEKITKRRLNNFNVLFLNTVNNFHEYIAASDMAIFPVKNMEGKFDLPLSLVEIMVMGKPVLHTNIKPLNELYCNSSGFSIPNNADIFSNKILEIINNNQYYLKLKNQTIIESKKFKPSRIIKKYHNLYNKLL